MTRSILIAVLLMLPLPTLAQTPAQPPPMLAPEAGAPSQVPPQQLDAMRHYQPSQQEVEQLERQSGSAASAQQRAQGKELDRLYDELMRRSAPAQGQ